MPEDRRLIEDFIPIREISVEAAREKSIRKGHISTLHLWWARRPLVAARAAVFASLIAAPETPQKRTALTKATIELCRWGAGEETLKKARRQILEAQRDRLGLPKDTPLKEVPPPKVLDMFAGGGAIPLEALRLGCETYAVELNPVAHIIELCTLVYPQKYGKELADEVEAWGNWVIEQVRAEIGDLYPSIAPSTPSKAASPSPSNQLSISFPHFHVPTFSNSTPSPSTPSPSTLTPVAYLWTRVVKCPNPACGAQVPLVRQTWLCKKKKKRKYVALKVVPNYETKRVEFEVVESQSEKGLGFDPASGSARGTSTCRHCGATVKNEVVKVEGKAGRIGQQLMAIVCTTPGQKEKTYLSGDDFQHYLPDEAAIQARLESLCQKTGLTVPQESLSLLDNRNFWITEYGITKFGELFTPRQLLALMTFVKWVRLAHKEMLKQGYEEEFGKVIATYLGLCLDKVSDYSSSCARWGNDDEGVTNTISRQAIPMVWDFAETNVLGAKTGGFGWALSFVLNVIKNLVAASISDAVRVIRGSATSQLLPNSFLDAIITDPPYFDSVSYADLSDFFYVWLKRSIGNLYSEHFSGRLTPKKMEAIMEPSRHGGNKQKAAQAYEDMMHRAFCEASRVLKPEGMMVVVYAHKTTAGWSTLIDSLRRAGFTITEAWPLVTESSGRLRAQNSAALASSIFLVARKRKDATLGDYAMDVKPTLSNIVRERVATLMAEGVTGADLVIACIGAGLRAYTQYERVELPNGEELDATSFLDDVQKEVVEAVLTKVMQCNRRNVGSVDKPSQYYIMARYEYGELAVDFDEANTLAKGVGVELDGAGGLTDGKLALVKKDETKIQLRDYGDRGAHKELGIQDNGSGAPKTATLIDMLHRLLWLAERKPSDIPAFLSLAQPDASQLRLVAQSLAGRALTPGVPNASAESAPNAPARTKEQAAIDTLLASWKRLVEDNLFTQGSSDR